MSSQALISLESVSKFYGQGNQRVEALKEIELSIQPGEFVTLVGPSGSGKSTILNIMGLIDRVDTGIVRLDGVDVSRYSDSELARLRRERIGLIFQSFNLIPILSVAENIGYPLSRSSLRPKHRKERVSTALAEVGLADLGHRLPNQLSGGQQQRVAIGRALVKKPSIILADEPTANLDSVNGQLIVELLRTLNRHDGVTVVLASHDERIIGIADRAIYLLDGAIRLAAA